MTSWFMMKEEHIVKKESTEQFKQKKIKKTKKDGNRIDVEDTIIEDKEEEIKPTNINKKRNIQNTKKTYRFLDNANKETILGKEGFGVMTPNLIIENIGDWTNAETILLD